jgi:NO-binding membrane sensor protein with MHYT domain
MNENAINEIVVCQHDLLLVTLSYVISVLGSYTALQLAVGIPAAKNSAERIRAIVGSGAVMGIGAIWSMHFIAMLACKMHIEVSYDLTQTIVSALVAGAACIAGIAIVATGTFSWPKLAAAAVLMGLGVAGMHYLGMAAMIMPAKTLYDQNFIYLSVAIAIVASGAALWLAFNMHGMIQRMGSALVMGVAVCGMHYTAMQGASFSVLQEIPNGLSPGIGGAFLGASIFIFSTIVLGVVLVVSVLRENQRSSLRI